MSQRLVEQATAGGGRTILHKEVLTAELPRGGGLSLVRKRLPEREPRAAVLLLHGFAQNRYTWHLDQRSFSAYLAARGYDVYNLELRGVGRSRVLGAPPPVCFEEHVAEDLPAALKVIEARGHPGTFLLGHSLGGAISYATAARQPSRVRGVVTISGVFRWGESTPAIQALARLLLGVDAVHRRRGWGSNALRLDVLGRAAARGLLALDSGWLPLPTEAWAPRSTERVVLREWLNRSFDLASGSVLALMGRWARTGRFQDTRGEQDYAEGWSRCGVPVLVLGGDRDRLAHAYRDVRPAYEASTASDRGFRCFGEGSERSSYGHIDLLIGRHASDEVWPVVAEWLDARS